MHTLDRELSWVSKESQTARARRWRAGPFRIVPMGYRHIRRDRRRGVAPVPDERLPSGAREEAAGRFDARQQARDVDPTVRGILLLHHRRALTGFATIAGACITVAGGGSYLVGIAGAMWFAGLVAALAVAGQLMGELWAWGLEKSQEERDTPLWLRSMSWSLLPAGAALSRSARSSTRPSDAAQRGRSAPSGRRDSNPRPLAWENVGSIDLDDSR